MFHLSTIVFGVLFLARINPTESLLCYVCDCVIVPGQTTCTDENDFQCVIEFVEGQYCYIGRTSNELVFGHASNEALQFLESLHYFRVEELIVYSESSGTWQAPTVIEYLYGCDFTLCNTPRIVSLLPEGLTFVVDPNILTNTLIPASDEPFTNCLSCSKCVNATSGLSCQTPPCTGTCYIEDYLDDPLFNTDSCLFAFESSCLGEIFNTSVQIIGTYYIDDKIMQVTEIDIWCRKTDCNDPTSAQTVRAATTHSTQFNDQLYFRPNVTGTTPSTPNSALLGCYVCDCTREVGSDDCKLLGCTIEYKNGSYCQIVRDFNSNPGMENIFLGHVQRNAVPLNHFIRAEEELILYRNLTWNPPSLKEIEYICDWELCNDARIVDRLLTSFQFNADNSEIAGLLHSSDLLNSCYECNICSNSSLDFDDKCKNTSCPSTGQCFINQYIDDQQFNDCEYAIESQCASAASDSSIVIAATYNIDADELYIDEVEVYCSKNNCNTPTTVYNLLELLSDDIQLDSLFFIRPSLNTTTPSIITEPVPTSTRNPVPTSTRNPVPTSTRNPASRGILIVFVPKLLTVLLFLSFLLL